MPDADILLSALPTGAATGGETFVGNQSGTTKTLTLSSDALSDYDPPTAWTPTITALTTAGTPVYSSQQGVATRIGKICTASYYLLLSDWTGSPAGQIAIDGLPYTCGAVGGVASRTSSTISFIRGFTLTGNDVAISGILYNSSTQIQLQKIATNTSNILEMTEWNLGTIIIYGAVTYATT